MSGKHIENRTLGELAAMRDTLQVASEDLLRSKTCDLDLRLTIQGILTVLASIVDETPFYHSPRVRERVAYKGGR